VLQALKQQPRTESIPVIVVSHLATNNGAQLKAAGAADYFEKSRFGEGNEAATVFLGMIERVLRDTPRRSEGGTTNSMIAPQR
jgi:chemotaxis response regulator CheB